MWSLSFFLTGTRKLEYAGSTWHESCFICNSCQQPIGSKSFIPDKDDHYCVPCYENKFAPRCTRCKQVSGVVLLSAYLPEIRNRGLLINPRTHSYTKLGIRTPFVLPVAYQQCSCWSLINSDCLFHILSWFNTSLGLCAGYTVCNTV